MAVGKPTADFFAAAALALAVALWMTSTGRGEEEVEDDEEDEDEEEVVVLGDAGCAAIRAGAALRASAVSAAATAWRMEAHSSGWRGRAMIQQMGGEMWSAAVCGGDVGLGFPPSGFSWAGLLQFRKICRGGKQFAWAAFGRRGGQAWSCGAVCEGRVWVIWRGWCAVGRGALRGGCVWVARCRGR